MRTLLVATLAVLLLVPNVALAQGPPPPTGPPPILPPMTAAEALDHYRQHPPDPVELQQRRATREELFRRLPGAPADSRTTPKPPDAVSPELRAQRPPPVPPSNPRPPEPPRRGEEPTDRLLRLLSLGSAPDGQNGVACGAGVQTSTVGYWAQYARGVMFCHAPDSFFTSQSMTAFQTVYWCSTPQYCAEIQVEQRYACGRWAYDWQPWYCPLDTSYVYDVFYCPQWTRILQYVTGVSPGGAPQYNDVVTSPWHQGCPIT